MSGRTVLTLGIDDMPLEIISYIFEFCCHENNLHPCIDPPAVSLSKVRTFWKSIISSTPRLWSSLFIDFTTWARERDGLRLLSITQTFMDLSSGHPLSITLTGNYYLYIDHTLNILAAHSSRWFDVDLRQASHMLDWNGLANIRGHVPRLTHLRLGPTEEIDPCDLFVDAPSLKSVYIIPDSNVGIQLPFEQLQFLKISTAFAEHAVPVLQRCTTVEALELDNIGQYIGIGYVPRVEMPRVEILNVVVHDEHDVSFIFQHLLLSRLSSLSVTVNIESECDYIHYSMPHWRVWEDVSRIRDFFSTCSCVLTTLHVQNLPTTDIHLLDLLSLLPLLRELLVRDLGQRTIGADTLSNRTITSTFLWRLFTLPIILPQLVDLTLYAQLHLFDAQALVELVSARRVAGRPKELVGITELRSIEVELEGSGDLPTELEQLKPFVDEGLRVEISRS